MSHKAMAMFNLLTIYFRYCLSILQYSIRYPPSDIPAVEKLDRQPRSKKAQFCRRCCCKAAYTTREFILSQKPACVNSFSVNLTVNNGDR